MFDFISRNFASVVFCTVWILVSILYSFNPYNYYSLSSETLSIVGITLLSGVLGLILSTLFVRNGKIYIFLPQNSKRFINFNYVNLRKLQLILILFGFIGAISLLLIFSSQADGIVDYLKNPVKARYIVVNSSEKIGRGWNVLQSLATYMTDLIYVSSITGGILFVRGKNTFHSILPLILSLLVSLFTFQRFFIINNFVLWFTSIVLVYPFMELSEKANLRKKILKLITFSSFVLMLFSFTVINLRVSYGEKNISLEKVTDVAIESNYTYFAGNIVSLDNFIQQNQSYKKGMVIFREFFKWFARFGLWDENDLVKGKNKFTDIGPTEVNTYTFIRRLYEDFGLIGTVILTFFWTFTVNFVSSNYFNKFSLLRLYLTSVLIFSLFMSFYDFTLIKYPFYLFMAILIFFIENVLLNPSELYSFKLANS